MKKLSRKRFNVLVLDIQDLMDQNPEMKKDEIKNLFLVRRHHAKDFNLIESSWSDLWREAFRHEMSVLIQMAKRTKERSVSDDSLQSLLWLLESEFALLPNAPRLQEYVVIAMKIVIREKKEIAKEFLIFEEWIRSDDNKLRLLFDKRTSLDELVDISGSEKSSIYPLVDRFLKSFTYEKRINLYRSVSGKYLCRYQKSHSEINFFGVARVESKKINQIAQIKKTFSIGQCIPPAMLSLLIEEKFGKKKVKKVPNIADYRKTA